MFRGGEILRPFLSQRRPGPQAGLPADLSGDPDRAERTEYASSEVWKDRTYGKGTENDRKTCIKAGPCGLGRRALYLNTFFLDRRLYACYEDIERIYKRIAMSAGGFSGRGVFAAVPYLVVELKDKRSRQCSFRSEEDVDTLMRWIGERSMFQSVIPFYGFCVDILIQSPVDAFGVVSTSCCCEVASVMSDSM